MKPFFQIGPLSFPAYTVFASIGALFAMLIIYNRAALIKDFTYKKYLLLILVLGLGVVIGSKILFVITVVPDIIKNWSFNYALNRIITAGFVFYGGLIGALIGSLLFSKRLNIPIIQITNTICPSFPLFHSFGRIGCLFGGCCYGIVIPKGFYHLESEPDISRLPVQLYESIVLLIITLLLFFIEKRNNNSPLMPIYLLLYSIWRFIIEFFRGDDIRGIWWIFSTSQWISIILFLISLTILATFHRKNQTQQKNGERNGAY